MRKRLANDAETSEIECVAGGRNGIAQQIVFREQQDVATQSFVDVAFIVAGSYFDFALSKVSHPRREGAMVRRKERRCFDEPIHFGVRRQSVAATALWIALSYHSSATSYSSRIFNLSI